MSEEAVVVAVKPVSPLASLLLEDEELQEEAARMRPLDSKMRAKRVAQKLTFRKATLSGDGALDLSQKDTFAISDKVAYCDPKSKLWKRGEVVYYVSPEYKVVWGGTWQWVEESLLFRDDGTLDFSKLKKGKGKKKRKKKKKKALSGDDSKADDSEESDESESEDEGKGQLIAGVDWSKFGNIMGDAMIEKLWKDADKDMNGYLDLEEMDVLLHEIVKLFLSKTQGIIAGGVTYAMTKPFVDMLRDSIINNLDADKDGTISYKEFQNYSMWIPSALKTMFSKDGSGLSLNLREFAVFVNEHMVSALIDRFSPDVQSLDLAEANLVCQRLIQDFVAKRGLKMKLKAAYTQPYVDRMMNMLMKTLHPALSAAERAKVHSISKRDLQRIKDNMTKLAKKMPTSVAQLREKLTVDLSQLYSFVAMDDRVLDAVWAQVDTNGDGHLSLDEFRLLLHSMIERYAHHMGLHSLLDVESVAPMVESMHKLAVTQLGLGFDAHITKDMFKNLPKLLHQMKSKALSSIDASKLSDFATQPILEEIWDEVDSEKQGYIESEALQPLIRALIVRYVSYAVGEAYATSDLDFEYRSRGRGDSRTVSPEPLKAADSSADSESKDDSGTVGMAKKAVIAKKFSLDETFAGSAAVKLKTSLRKTADLVQFGVVDTVLKGLMPTISARMDVDRDGHITREEFLDSDTWLPNMNHYMKMFSFDEFEAYLNRGVVSKLWLQFDESGRGYVTREELRAMLNSLMASYAEQIGLSAFCGASTVGTSAQGKMEKMLGKFTDMIFARFDADGDGKITKEELSDLKGAVTRMKIDMLNAFNWNSLSEYMDAERISNAWESFAGDDEEVGAEDVRSMIALMVNDFTSDALKEAMGKAEIKHTRTMSIVTDLKDRLAGIESVDDLHAFGIVSHAVDSICSLISSASVIRMTAVEAAGSGRGVDSDYVVGSPAAGSLRTLKSLGTGHLPCVSVGLMTFRETAGLAGPVSATSMLDGISEDGHLEVPASATSPGITQQRFRIGSAVAGVRLGIGNLYDEKARFKKSDLMAKLPKILEQKQKELKSMIVSSMEKVKHFDFETLSSDVVGTVILSTLLSAKRDASVGLKIAKHRLDDELKESGVVESVDAISMSEIEAVVSDAVRAYLLKMSTHGSIIAAQITPVVSHYVSELKQRLTEAGIVDASTGAIATTDLRKFAVKLKGGPTLADAIQIDYKGIENEFVGHLLKHWSIVCPPPRGNVPPARIRSILHGFFEKYVSVEMDDSQTDTFMKEDDVKHGMLKHISELFLHNLLTFAFGSEANWGDASLFMDNLEDDGSSDVIRIAKVDVAEIFNPKVMNLVVSGVKSQIGKMMQGRLLLSLLALDASTLGRIITKDRMELWKQFDADESGALDHGELTLMISSVIQRVLEEQKTGGHLSRAELKPVVAGLTASVMEACDTDGDGLVTREEFEDFIEFLQKSSQIPDEVIVNATNLLQQYPENEALQLVVSNADAPLYDTMRSQVEMFVDKSIKARKDGVRMRALSKQFMASTLASQVLNTEELSSLLALPTDEKEADEMHPKMRAILQEIQEDVLQSAMQSAQKSKQMFHKARGGGGSVRRSVLLQTPTQGPLRRSTGGTQHMGKFGGLNFTGDDFSVLQGAKDLAKGAVAGAQGAANAADDMAAKAMLSVVRGMAEVGGFNEAQLKSLDLVLDGVEDGWDFIDRLLEKVNDKIALAEDELGKVALDDLLKMIKGKNFEETSLFTHTASSLDELVKEEAENHLWGMKGKFVAALETSIRKRAGKGMGKQYCEWLWAILLGVGFRVAGVLIFGLSLALLAIASGLSTFFLALNILTLGFVEEMVVVWYFSVVSIVLLAATMKSGVAMLIMPLAAILGLAEFTFEMFFTNVFAARLVVKLEKLSRGGFSLTKFCGILVNYAIELTIFILNRIELEDMLVQSVSELQEPVFEPPKMEDMRQNTHNRRFHDLPGLDELSATASPRVPLHDEEGDEFQISVAIGSSK